MSTIESSTILLQKQDNKKNVENAMDGDMESDKWYRFKSVIWKHSLGLCFL